MNVLPVIPLSIFLGFSLTTIPLVLLRKSANKHLHNFSKTQLRNSTYFLLFATLFFWFTRIGGLIMLLDSPIIDPDIVIPGWYESFEILPTVCLGILPLLFSIKKFRSNTYLLCIVSLAVFLELHSFEILSFFEFMPYYHFSLNWGLPLFLYVIVSFLFNLLSTLFSSVKNKHYSSI